MAPPDRQHDQQHDPGPDAATNQQRILSASAIMATGTVFSRISGFLRAALLVAALGQQLHADVFNIANTVPNMLYILLAGGIFNAVLVPQLVRAGKRDADGGQAYTDRVVTLGAVFLATVSVVLVLTAPWVMQLFLSPDFRSPELSAQKDSVIAFARLCLPQVFFYGMFVLVGQILNARGRFGPMMWAPIANNIISIAVLVTYLAVFGPAKDLFGGYTREQELLLGLGSTLGIVVQFLILIPYLHSVGYRFRPRFDFRDNGLGHTLQLGIWTVLFVVVNQVAYTVVVRLASSGTASSVLDQSGKATGYTVYSQAFLVVMGAHSVVTVSLATAILPLLSRYAAEGRPGSLARTLMGSLRTCLAVVVPFAALLAILAPDVANVLWGHGAGRTSYHLYVPTLTLFGVGLVFFTVHYLMLRGFYALERTRTVFFIQCAVAATNIVVAVVLVRRASPVATSPMLVLGYIAAYVVGAVVSFLVLRRALGPLAGRSLVRFSVRVGLAVAVVWAPSYLIDRLVHAALPSEPSWVVSGLWIVLLSLGAGLGYLTVARTMRIGEVTEVVDAATRRLRRNRTAEQ